MSEDKREATTNTPRKSNPADGDMRRYFDRTHNRAEKQGRPVSELLFEDYCDRVEIDWRHIEEEADAKTPDYELVIDGWKIIAEVKETTRNKKEQESDRLLEERVYGNVLKETPGARVRDKIKVASPQIKAKTEGRHPGILVLYDNGQIAGHLSQRQIMMAMYGQVVVDMAIPRDTSIRSYITGTRFGLNRKMTPAVNTSISAIGTLVVTGPDRPIELCVYHNSFAAVPVEPILLARRGIVQYQIDSETMRWVELR